MSTLTTEQIDAAIPNVPATLPVPAGTPRRDLTNAVIKALHADVLALEARETLTPDQAAALDALGTGVIGSGTVTSVNVSVPAGLTATGGPVTGAGTLAIDMAPGYEIPTTAKQTEWDGKATAASVAAAVAGKADTSALTAGLAGKANTAHTHAIGDVTNLQTTLDGKAATTHSHPISSVTGLQAALDAKLSADLAEAVTTVKATPVAGDQLLGLDSAAAGAPVLMTVAGIRTGLAETSALTPINAAIAALQAPGLVEAKTTTTHYVFGAYASIIADMMRLSPRFGSSARDTSISPGVTPTATIYIHPTLGLDANAGTSHTAPKQTLPASSAATTKYLIAAGTTVNYVSGNTLHTQGNNCVVSVYDANPSSVTYGQEITWQPDPFLRALFGGWVTTEERALYFTLQGPANESWATNDRGFQQATVGARSVIRGAIIRGFRFCGVQVNNGTARIEDCVFEDLYSQPQASNSYYGGAAIRLDVNATAKAEVARCFFEDIGEDAIFATVQTGSTFSDCAIKHITRRQQFGGQHSDVFQMGAYPGAVVLRRVVIYHQVAMGPLQNSGNGETLSAGAVVMSTGTAGTDTPGGLIEDVVFVSNRQGIYFQRQSGVTLRNVVGLIVGDTSVSQTNAITWERTGNTEDGCVFATLGTTAAIRSVMATGAVNKSTTIDLGRLDA